MCDHFKMIWITAHALIAQVIYLFFAGNIAMFVDERDDMDRYGLTVERHSGITTSPTGATVRSLPDPTGSVMSSIFDFHIFPDFLSDPISAIHIVSPWLFIDVVRAQGLIHIYLDVDVRNEGLRFPHDLGVVG